MNMRTKTSVSSLFALAALFFVAGCGGSRQAILRTADAVAEEAVKEDYDITAMAKLAAGFNPKDFSGKRIRRYSDSELDRLGAVLGTVTFYFPENYEQVEMLESVFVEMSERNILDEPGIRGMYRTYLGARLFSKAAELRQRFPGIKFYSMPEKIVSELPPGVKAWRVYAVPDDGRTIEAKASKLGEGRKIVMLMLPGCGVSEKAMRELLDDPAFGPAFQGHGVVLTSRINAESVALWKSHFAFPEVYLAYKSSDFPGFDFDSSPNFYFLRDGAIKYNFTGWSNNGNPDFGRTEMTKGLAAISVSSEPAVSGGGN